MSAPNTSKADLPAPTSVPTPSLAGLGPDPKPASRPAVSLADAVAESLAGKLSVATKELIGNYKGGPNLGLQHAVAEDVNWLIQNESLYDPKLFGGVVLPPRVQALATTNPQGRELLELNLALLGQSFPGTFNADAVSWQIALEGIDFDTESKVYVNGHALGPEAAVKLERPGLLSFHLRTPAYRAGQLVSVVVFGPGAETPSDAVEIRLPETSLTTRPVKVAQSAEASAIPHKDAPLIKNHSVVGPLFSTASITNLPGFVSELKTPTLVLSLSQYLAARLSAGTSALLTSLAAAPGPDLQQAIADDLNQIVQSGPVFDAARFAGVTLRPETRQLQEQDPRGTERVRLNVMLLLDAYPTYLSAGASIWSVVLQGANFRPDSRPYIDGNVLAANDRFTFVDAGTLSLKLFRVNHPADATRVAVLNPEPNGGLSQELELMLLEPFAPQPAAAGPTPFKATSETPSRPALSASPEVERTIAAADNTPTGWMLTLHGAGFRPLSVVYMDGRALSGKEKPSLIDPEMLRIKLMLTVHTPGNHTLAVLNPEPNGGLSEMVNVMISQS
jgi:hypothetical protein